MSAPLSNELYARLVELSPDAIVLLQGDRYVFCNQRFHEMFGYTPQDVRDGLSFLQLVREQDLPAVRERYAARLGGENPPPRFRLTLRRKDGTTLVCETSAALVTHEGRPADLVLMRDVPDDAQTRAALQASQEAAQRAEERFRIAFQISPDGITISRLADGKILELNDGATRMSGYSREELLGKSSVGIGALDARARERFAAALKRDGAVDNFEVRFLTKDGRERAVLLSARLTEVGGETCVLTFGRDVTEQAENQEALQRLARVNRALTSRLFVAQEQERVEIARELHDGVGQVLAVLKMESEWLGGHAEQPAEVREAAKRLTSLADEMLLVVRRLARGLRPALLDDLGLASALASMVGELRPRAPIQLEAQLTELPDLPRETGISLYRIAQEALTNVLRHSGAQRCRLTLERDRHQAVLSIEDDGVGLAAEGNEDASCLGLAGMRERAELLGGTLDLGAAAGGGTRVCARVPRTAGSAKSD